MTSEPGMPSSTSQPLLSVDDVSVTLAGTPILEGVSLPPLNNGDVLGVIGANGAGKSTLIRRLAGDIRSPGQVAVDGCRQASMSRDAWRRLAAHMPQQPPQESALSPFELVRSAARALGLGKDVDARVEGLLIELGLRRDALAPLSALSGGKRQLVGLALVLIRSPRLLLLDEPTAALDLRWRLQVLQLVQRHAQSGAAAVIAVHDLDLAARFCTRLTLLANRGVIASGAPHDVLTSELIAQVYGVRATVAQGEDGILTVRPIAPVA